MSAENLVVTSVDDFTAFPCAQRYNNTCTEGVAGDLVREARAFRLRFLRQRDKVKC